MGSSGGGDPNVDNQIQQNEQEMQYKREQLYSTRLGLIKSQATPTWNDPNAAAEADKSTPIPQNQTPGGPPEWMGGLINKIPGGGAMFGGAPQ